MGAKFTSKTHLQNVFFDFLSRFLRVCLQSFQKVLIQYDEKTNFFNKKKSKNAEFHSDFESFEKVVKKMHQKSYDQNKLDEHE
jgi:hypothetical protein